MEDIIKIVKSLEDSGSLLKGVTETVQIEVKEQKEGFLRMLLGTLGARLLGNLLTWKGIYRAGKGKGTNRAGEGIVRAGYGRPLSTASHNNKMDFYHRLILQQTLKYKNIIKMNQDLMVFFLEIICQIK